MKTTKRKTATSNAKIVVASVLLSLPIAHDTMSAQNKGIQEKTGTQPAVQLSSRQSIHMKFSDKLNKIKGEHSIVGIDNGSPVYKNGRGEYFSIDPSTGDMKFLSAEVFSKFMCCAKAGGGNSRKLSMTKFISGDISKRGVGDKDVQTKSIEGVDDKGNVIHINSRGEKFYLDSYTGDMIFVK